MVPEIVVTTVRLEPLARVRRALQGADARIPVDKELMGLVREALGGASHLDPMDRYYLEELTTHKVAPMADPWDLAQVMYPALCLPGSTSLVCKYESVSGLCTAIAELEDLFLETHARAGSPVLAMEELRPPYGAKSRVVHEPAALVRLRERFAAPSMIHPDEDDPRLPTWRLTRMNLGHVLDATRSTGVGLLVYQP